MKCASQRTENRLRLFDARKEKSDSDPRTESLSQVYGLSAVGTRGLGSNRRRVLTME